MTKRVLVAPLDWGLGHATRSIPIIEELLDRDHNVSVASAGDALLLLKKEFPSLRYFELPPYDPSYASKNMVLNMLKQLPKFSATIEEEHARTSEIVKEANIDVVISDNRYGCYAENVTSVLMTHQLNIMTPASMRWTKPVIDHTVKRYVDRFQRCWIPDFPDHRLSGDLSVGNVSNSTDFVGPLSRLRKLTTSSLNERYYLLVLLSGPEPQRTKLENLLLPQLERIEKPCVVIRGVMSGSPLKIHTRHTVLDYAGGEKLAELIQQSSMVVSRPGYSTIMDLSMLEKKAVFVPTPGQTEQEYLGNKFMSDGVALSVKQDSVELERAIKLSADYTGFAQFHDGDNLLGSAMDQVGL